MADPPLGGSRVNYGNLPAADDRREQSAEARLAAADERDVTARARDVAAVQRDEVAAARYRAASRRDAIQVHDGALSVSASERIIRAAGQRKRAARTRADAAEQRVLADEDRLIAAQDREQSAFERMHALVDRERLADALASAAVDSLTGARMRAPGLIELERELLCCHRTGRSLVVAYVDIVGLKTLNDTAGHGAGDELLVGVVALLKEHLRAYDLIIRIGGDEFLCAMGAMTLLDARLRFAGIAETLAAARVAASIRTGFAMLAPGETTAQLIARADGQLIGRSHTDH